jgi:hypothetical protein
MNRLKADKFFHAFHRVTNMGQVIGWLEKTQPNASLAMLRRDYEEVCAHLGEVADELKEVGLLGAERLARSTFNELQSGGSQNPDGRIEIPYNVTKRVHRGISDLCAVLQSEFVGKHVLVVPSDKAQFYQEDEPFFGSQFGPEVASKFRTKGKFEIGEAGNCLALGRDTACAFHLMRAVEAGLQGLEKCLRLQPTTNKGDKTWGAVLGKIREELDRKDDLLWRHQWTSMEDRKFFNDVHALLVLIKDAFRDPTMHLERVFTAREARHLFALVHGLMEKMASRLDEDGLPQA